MSYIRTWLLGALILTLVPACGASKQATAHAVAIEVAHGLVDTAGHAVDDGCAIAVRRAGSLARAEEIASTCREAASTQRALVAAWGLWARSVLAKLAEDAFDLNQAALFGREVLRLYMQLAEAVNAIAEGDPLPPPPEAIRLLLGGDL